MKSKKITSISILVIGRETMREEYRHPLAVRLAVVVMCIGLLLCAPLPLDRTVLAQTTQNPMAAHEIVILIDKSSSIRDLPGGMQTFKDAGKKFLRNILKASSTEKRVAIVAYDWEDVGVKVYKELTTLTDSNLPELVAAIDAIPPPGSWTGTARAIDTVCDITQSEPGLGFMLHLTDGCANRPVGQEEGKRAAEEAYDHFKVNCSLVGIVGVNLDPEAEEHLRKMASPGLFSSVQIDENSVDPGYDIAQAMTQVAYGVGETDVRIAVLDSDSEPEYFTGELKNSVEAALQIARSRGFKAQPITPSEIAAGLLYSYDTLVLPDNAPPADVVSNIMAWWIGGGHIVAIDSGLTFILYAGMLFPELADKHASFSEGTYWSYDSSNATTVQKGHPVIAGHTPGEQIAAVARDALLRIDKLPSGAQVLAIDAGNADWATVVFYQGAGSLTFIGPSDDSFALAPIIGNAIALDVSSMGIVPDAKTLTVAAVQGSEEEWLLVREEFQSQHPNVEIELIYLPEGALFPRIEASFREGHPFADVVMVYRDWVPDLIDRGVLLDLSVYKDRFVKERVLPIEYNGIPIGVPWRFAANWVVCVFALTQSEQEAIELLLVAAGTDTEPPPKLSPELFYLLEDPYARIGKFPEEIQTQLEEYKTVPVAIWLTAPLPEYIEGECNKFRSDVGASYSLNKVRKKRQDFFEAKSSWYKKAGESTISFLRDRHFWDEDKTSYACLAAPVLYTDLPVDPSKRLIFEELQNLDAVDTIYLAGVFEPKLDSAVSTIEVPTVWSRKDSSGNDLKGTGVKIAIVESGRIDLTLAPFDGSGRKHITRNPGLGSDDHKIRVAQVVASCDGTLTGVASEAVLLSADSKDHTEKELAAAIDWALKKGADVLNASFGEEKPAGKPTSSSRLLDFIVIEHMRAFTVAAGNEGKAAFVCSPASGYNVIAVGGIDDKGTVSWADDTMYDLKANDGSNSVNPTFPAGGRQKPDVCAVAVGIDTVGYTPKTGTSYSAPAVAGTIGLLIQRQPWLAVWPEVTKAVVMASAIHNVTGASRLDGWEGAGTVVASEADNVVINNWLWKKVAGKADFPITIKFNVNKGETVRFVITWDSHAQRVGGLVTVDKLEANLNLEIFDPTGKSITKSASSNNSYEIVEFVAGATGVYQARISQASFKAAFEYVGAAWHRSAVPHLQFSGGLTSITVKPGKKVSIELRGMPGHDWALCQDAEVGTSHYLGLRLDLSGCSQVHQRSKFDANGRAKYEFILPDYSPGQKLYLQAISGTGDLRNDLHKSNVLLLEVK